MSKVEEKLNELGIDLPPAPTPLGAYKPAVVTGNLIFISGQLPLVEGRLVASGKLGAEVSVEQGIEAARVACLNAIAIIKSEIGELDRVTRIVKLNGSVASTPGFNDQAQVLNGASNLCFDIFGERGIHARAAVGVAELPLDSPVELEVIAEIG